MTTEYLFQQFIQSGLYLRGWSEKTPLIYRRALASFEKNRREARDTPVETGLTKTQLEAWIISMRKRGLARA